MAQKKGLLSIAGVVALYWFVSISLVFVNKLLLSGSATIPAPIFITQFQCLFTAVACYVLGEVKTDSFPKQNLDLNLAYRVMPLSVVFVGMITFNNLCLRFVEVSFYNVARSLTILFNICFSYLILGSTTTMKEFMCVLVIVLGFFLGVEGEVNFSLVGSMFGVISSIFVCLNSIYTKKTLPIVKGDMWKLAFVNNVNAIVLFTPFVLYFESDLILQNTHILREHTYWMGMCVSGVLGLSIGLCTVMQIRATTPLTHNVSATAKAAFQTFLAIQYWGNETTSMVLIGVALVLLGSFLYSYVRSLRPQPKAQKEEHREEAQPEADLEKGAKKDDVPSAQPST